MTYFCQVVCKTLIQSINAVLMLENCCQRCSIPILRSHLLVEDEARSWCSLHWVPFSSLTLLIGRQEERLTCNNWLRLFIPTLCFGAELGVTLEEKPCFIKTEKCVIYMVWHSTSVAGCIIEVTQVEPG